MSLLPALLPLLAQDDLPRTGWILAGVTPPESVAGHVLGVAQLALALAPEVAPPLDLGRVLAMALVHDAAEVQSGDLPRRASRALPPGAKAALDTALGHAVLAPLGPAALAADAEYRSRTTRESRFVALCDRLQLGVRLVGYLRAARTGLDDFAAGLAELDAAEFAPCAALLDEILAACGRGPRTGTPASETSLARPGPPAADGSPLAEGAP